MKLRTTIFPLLVAVAASLSATAQEPSENPLANVSQNPGLCSIFHKWGFIGDSLCSGEFEYTRPDGKTGYYDAYEYSWGQRMCALMGVKGDNYSQGGETALEWPRHFWDRGNNWNNHIVAKDDPKQAYIVALGVNDKYPNPERKNYVLGDFATDIDMNNYENNAKTFIGCYAGVIQRVRSIAPDSFFFLVTMPEGNEVALKYNDAIRKMATLFPRTYIIDLGKYVVDQYKCGSQWRTDHYLSGHLSPAGYEYTAWMMMTYIDWIIRHDMEAFKLVGFIGTDKLK